MVKRIASRLRPFDRSLGAMPYLWLLFVAPIPIGLLIEHASARAWLVDGGSVVVFLPLYVLAFRLCGARKLFPVAGMFVLGAIVVPRETDALCYFIYGAGMFGYAFESQRKAYLGVAIFVLATAAVLLAQHVADYAWIPTAIFAAVIGLVNVIQAQSERMNDALRVARDDVERLAKMAERERIARDLHDVLGHTLSVIALKSQLAARLAESDPARAGAEIADVETIARRALTELRETVAGYRSAGLAAEVDRARFVLATAGVAVECDVVDVQLGAIEENVLALALREAVTNVVRHARAELCRVRVASAGGACTLEVADDGAHPSGTEGAGLRGMRERVEAVGGTLARDLSHGTKLRVSVPLARDGA